MGANHNEIDVIVIYEKESKLYFKNNLTIIKMA